MEPEVYKINKGSSASITSGSHTVSHPSIKSCQYTSLPSCISTLLLHLSTTTIFSKDGHSLAILFAFSFIGISCFVPRTPLSCVIKSLHSESLILFFNASLENAPNTTECTAPMRAHANIATIASGIICI